MARASCAARLCKPNGRIFALMAVATDPECFPAAAGQRFASIEAGGTKFNVAIGEADGRILDKVQLRTRSPDDTIADVTGWLHDAIARHGALSAIGLAMFGPINTDRRSLTWGCLGGTPKTEWQGVDMITPFARFGVPLGLDTDVNGAALAEGRWGAGRGCDRICYLTVGTGIGGGAVLDDKILSGRSHPEMGHVFVRRYPGDDFAGVCPVHGDCLEGLASGTAIRARWGAPLSELDPTHPGHAIIAEYLAQACVNIVATLAPDRIVLGGGVMSTVGLVATIRKRFERLSSGYFAGFDAKDIVLAELFPLSGLAGGFAIAAMAAASDAQDQKRPSV